MVKIIVEVSKADVASINQVLRLTDDFGANTHGKLNIEKLAAMLLQDVAHAVRRPGSWEGHNMSQLLNSHGYEVSE